MKKSVIIFSIILLPVDYLMLLLASFLAYQLRVAPFLASYRPAMFVLELPLQRFLESSAIVAICWLLIFAFHGLYSIRPWGKLSKEMGKIFTACSVNFALLLAYLFFQREFFNSRFIILAILPLSFVCVAVGRLSVRNIQRQLFLRGIGVELVAVIGSDQTAEDLTSALYRQPRLGYRIVEKFSELTEETYEQLANLLRQKRLDQIIQADPTIARDNTLRLIALADEYHVGFQYAADLLNAKALNVDIQTIDAIPLVAIRRTPLEGWGRVAKRLFDVVFSLLSLIIIIPVAIIVAVMIKLDSEGPVLKKLKRIGAKGELFYLYKFRSMVKEAENMKNQLLSYNERQDGPLFKMKDDPRITKVGKIIRQWSVDEFAQVINVLKGEMSWVGPRPHEPVEVAQYQAHHKKLLTIKPGITGLAQVSGRTSLSFEEEARLDTFYVEHWSLLLDFKIILKTPWVIIARKGVGE
ncbi:MAG: sugar transferase [bacterium]